MANQESMGEAAYVNAQRNKTSINDIANKFHPVYVSQFTPSITDGEDGDIWFKIADALPITDCLFHFDASRLDLANNAKVATWADLSENSNDLVQATAESQPTYLSTGLNGKPTASFLGAQSLDKATFALDSVSAFTYFAVVQPTDISETISIFNIGVEGVDLNPARRCSLTYSSSHHGYRSRINGNGHVVALDNTVNVALITDIYDHLKNTIFKNAVLGATIDYSSTIGTHDTLRVGKSLVIADTEAWVGNISEIIYYSRAFTQSELDIMHAYLKEKWGIT